MKTYVKSDKLSKLLFKKKKISILACVLFGAFTPLCACGTTAVLIGMLTTTLPWGPIMAFLTSSPLMSPDGFVLISGVIGLKFAIALTVASIIIGIASGFITNLIESKTNFLKNQSRFAENEKEIGCSCNKPETMEFGCNKSEASKCECNKQETSECGCNSISTSECACGETSTQRKVHFDKFKIVIYRFKLKQFLHEFYTLGLKQILLYYSIFICIGFLINYFIPSSIISVLFGANSLYAVPLASIIGLPLYITTDSGIPIIQSMIQSGASQGAMLAFMITGSATSAWVIAGLTTFMKKRAIALYVAFVFLGGIISGYLLDIIVMFS